MMTRPVSAASGMAAWQWCRVFLLLPELLFLGCALNPGPRQMYEGPPLPKEQVGIIYSGCVARSGLTITTTKIDGKDIEDGCADFALLPGEHRLELTAKQLAPKLDGYVVGSGSVLGGPTTPMSARPEQMPQVLWASQSPLAITCTVLAGQEVTIIGARGAGQDWQAQCQERTK
ncbi:MAG TPA: hypothetical protein VLS44_03525 [Nitrospira sp.]|nr:hypothetical protein [Nitrospira sp.]